MRSHTIEFAWYRFHSTFARRWTAYLSVVVLIGLTGGLAMASVAAARRTQSSYLTFLKSTNPSTLTMAIFGGDNGQELGPNLSTKFEALADVSTVRALSEGAAVPLTPSGAPRFNTLNDVNLVGSLDGYLLNEDRLSALQGQLFNPKSLNEVEVTPGAARIWNC